MTACPTARGRGWACGSRCQRTRGRRGWRGVPARVAFFSAGGVAECSAPPEGCEADKAARSPGEDIADNCGTRNHRHEASYCMCSVAERAMAERMYLGGCTGSTASGQITSNMEGRRTQQRLLSSSMQRAARVTPSASCSPHPLLQASYETRAPRRVRRSRRRDMDMERTRPRSPRHLQSCRT